MGLRPPVSPVSDPQGLPEGWALPTGARRAPLPRRVDEMNAETHYTPYHPKWYRRPLPVLWWLMNPSYTKFMLRELTCIFVAWFAVVTLWQVRALVEGREAFDQFLNLLRSPAFVVLDAVSFLFVLYHAVTWFNATPKAMVVRMGGKRAPDALIVGLNYFAWLVLSLIVAWFLARGRL